MIFHYYSFYILGTVALRGAHFGAGSGPIFLETFNCDGSEENLLMCSSGLIGLHTCNHNQDAGVQCKGKSYDRALLYIF